MAMIRKLFGLQAPAPGLVVVSGRVAIGATGAVGAQTGKGFSVARTGTGLYTVTLDSSGGVPNILFANAVVGFATGSNTQDVKVLTVVPASKLFTLQTSDAATVDTAADPPSGSFLQVLCVVQNTSSTG
jgi:hypothetical protein